MIAYCVICVVIMFIWHIMFYILAQFQNRTRSQNRVWKVLPIQLQLSGESGRNFWQQNLLLFFYIYFVHISINSYYSMFNRNKHIFKKLLQHIKRCITNKFVYVQQLLWYVLQNNYYIHQICSCIHHFSNQTQYSSFSLYRYYIQQFQRNKTC